MVFIIYWILLSVLAAFLWAVVNTVDKYVLSKWAKPQIPVMFFGLVSLVSATLVYVINGIAILSWFEISLTCVAAILHILAMFLYFKAVNVEEVSRIVPLFQLEVVYITMFAALFFGEIFSASTYVGIFLVVLGGAIVSMRNRFILKASRGVGFMIASSFCFTSVTLIIKHLLFTYDYWSIFTYVRFFSGIMLIPFFVIRFGDLSTAVEKHGKRIVPVITLNETINILALLSFTIALSTGFVTLVEALQPLQPFFVLLFTVLFSIFWPHHLKEDIEKKNIIVKIFAILMIFIGVFFITQ